MAEALRESLREACASGNLKACEFYLSPETINSANKVNGFTPLHWANARGHKDIVEFLIMNGADQNIKDSKGRIPADLFNPKPFQDGGFVPNYIANPDMSKLWGIPPANERMASLSLPLSLNSVNRVDVATASASVGEMPDTYSVSAANLSSSLSRKVSFKGNLISDNFKSASGIVALDDDKTAQSTCSPEDRTRSNSAEWDGDSRQLASKRSSIRKSVSFLDPDVIDGDPVQKQTLYSTSAPNQNVTLTQTSSTKSFSDDFMDPSKTIDGSMRRSTSQPLNPTMPALADDKLTKVTLTEVLVFKDFKSQLKLKGSIFISSETSLLGLHGQLLQEIDDMPQDFILQKERDGLYIPINRQQLQQSAAVHFRNSNLIYTCSI